MYAGNTYPRETWQDRVEHELKAEYQWKALMLYLDETNETQN